MKGAVKADTRSRRRLSEATTRIVHADQSGHPRSHAEHLLAPDQVIVSPETGLDYAIEGFLGEGGFGQVYLARRCRPSTAVLPKRLY